MSIKVLAEENDGEITVYNVEELNSALSADDITKIYIGNSFDYDSTITISKTVEIDGKNNNINYIGNDNNHALNISANDVVVSNLNIIAAKTDSSNVPVIFSNVNNGQLVNVSIDGASNLNIALMVDSSSVSVTNLDLKGHGVNVGNSQKLTGANSSFDGNFSNASVIYADSNDYNNGKVTFGKSVSEWSKMRISNLFGSKYYFYFDSLANAAKCSNRLAETQGKAFNISLDKDITLFEDITLHNGTIKPTSTLTIDLNGHNIVGDNQDVISASNSITITDSSTEYKGSIIVNKEQNANGSYLNAILIRSAAMVKINGVNIVGGYSGINIDSSNYSHGAIINGGSVSGKYGILVYKNGSVTLNDGTISSNNGQAAISGNGTVNNGKPVYGNTSIAINGGLVEGYKDETGNYLSTAIYHPQDGKLLVNGNANIIGTSAVEMRAGTLAVKADENGNVPILEATGDFRMASNGSGSTGTGISVLLSQHSTDLETIAIIEDGIFKATGNNGKALYIEDVQNTTAQDKVKAIISGGNFNADVEKENSNLTSKIDISGGIYTNDPNKEYIVPGYKSYPLESGLYEVRKISDIETDAIIDTKENTDVKISVDDAPITADELANNSNVAIDGASERIANDSNIINENLENKALEEVKKLDNNASMDDVKIVVVTNTNIELVDVKQEGNNTLLSYSIEPTYTLVATTVDTDINDLNDSNSKVLADPQVIDTTGTSVKVTLPLAIALDSIVDVDNIIIEHIKSDGTKYYHKVDSIDYINNTITFTNDKGFSTFNLIVDTRKAFIHYGNGLNDQEFSIADIDSPLAIPTLDSNHRFIGWRYDGKLYTKMTKELFDLCNGQTLTLELVEEVINTSTTVNTNNTYDDGGPFTTDVCGNIYDRWNNKIYSASSCVLNDGYRVPNTGVK